VSEALTDRELAIKATLDAVRARCDVASRRAVDPVGFVHRFGKVEDRELVALVAACTAFGNVKTIGAKLEDLLDRLGPSPSLAAEHARELRARLRGWKHRVFRGEDIARLLAGARAVQRADGSLGARFERELDNAKKRELDNAKKRELDNAKKRELDNTRKRKSKVDLRDLARARAVREADESSHEVMRIALAAWCDAIRAAGGLGRGRGGGRALAKRRGPAHLLPDPRGNSGNKRLSLFLRWMIRPADGVDLGLWKLDPASLLVPVDVHIHKLSRNLGFTRARGLSLSAARDITRALSRLDPTDPAGYDFSLCHMGMLQRCPSRRDARRCEGCGVKPVCVHWTGASS
jgi:uncharacterized protein (TIGR02757 family)